MHAASCKVCNAAMSALEKGSASVPALVLESFRRYGINFRDTDQRLPGMSNFLDFGEDSEESFDIFHSGRVKIL